MGTFKEHEFSKYIHEKLLLTANTKHHTTTSKLHSFRRTLCVRMAIAILCVAMDPQAVFVQTFIGLTCYAYGLLCPLQNIC